VRDQHTTWRQQNSVLIAAAADSHYDSTTSLPPIYIYIEIYILYVYIVLTP
jgi:hypothetical protein